MFFVDKNCRTCRSMQKFRKLDDRERAVAKDRHRYVHDLWRCTAVGCRWYQPWAKQSDGDLLPEEFQIPAAAEE